MRMAHLITDITNELEDRISPDIDYLLSEYNSLVESLLLILPESDASISTVPVDKVISTSLKAKQITRVLHGGGELLRASDALRELLPCGRLYTPHDGEIAVTVDGECTVFYRELPKNVDAKTYMDAELPVDARYIPLVRTWMWYKTYIYLGDYDSAKVYFDEYEKHFKAYCTENGVRE